MPGGSAPQQRRHWARLALVALVAVLLILGSPYALHDDRPGAQTGALGKPKMLGAPGTSPDALAVYATAPGEAPAYLLVDVAVDEDFQRQAGPDWQLEAQRLVQAASSFLQEAGLGLKVASVQQWRSDDATDSMEALIASAERQAGNGSGHALLAITCQDTVTYDGWAQEAQRRAIVRFYHDDQGRNATLIAHEIGHLLGARHHGDEQSCHEDGCFMDELGYARAAVICDYHKKVIQAYIAAALG